MNLSDYQKWSVETAVYPGATQGTTQALSYVVLALAGEVGEIANVAKKLVRDDDNETRRQQMRDELGDVCWYMARLADELGVELEDILMENHHKLAGRKERGTLHDNGGVR